MVSAIVFFGGYLTMFTGLAKPASEMCLVIAALGIFAIAAVRGVTSLLPCSLALVIGLLLHRSSIFLIPTWLVAAALWGRQVARDGTRRSARAWLAIGLPILVAAITSQKTNRLFPFEALIDPPDGGLALPSKVMLTHIRSIDKARLGKKIGSLSRDELIEVDDALRVTLDL